MYRLIIDLQGTEYEHYDLVELNSNYIPPKGDFIGFIIDENFYTGLIHKITHSFDEDLGNSIFISIYPDYRLVEYLLKNAN
jgi:hypothetical protein